MHKCTVDEIISDQLTVNPGFWGQLPVFPALNWRENEWAQIVLHTCKAAVDKKHLLTLPSNSTGTLLAPPSRPHAFTRGSEQCVASDNSSPPHPATHLHHTSRRRQVCTQFNLQGRDVSLLSSLTVKLLRLSSCFSYEAENGVSPGHTPLGSQSPGLTLHTSFPQGQRRESFLYRSDSDYDMSPKTVSRNSSLTSEGWDSGRKTKRMSERRREHVCVCLCVYPCVSGEVLLEWMLSPIFSTLSVPTSLRHTAEDFIVTPFAQVSSLLYLL